MQQSSRRQQKTTHHSSNKREKHSPTRSFSPRKPKTKILTQEEHPLDESLIDPKAIWVLERLNSFGHLAYLVGGSVRDLLLGRTPKDFDISTDATPNDIRKLFANSRTIGRRFLITHIYFRDGDVIEVSTFRSLPTPGQRTYGPRAEDNDFGSPEEDALRRDLTINGLFYDHRSGRIIDHVHGLVDLQNSTIRTIGEPRVRFQEDPVRMLRTIRHAARNQFEIEPNTRGELKKQARLLHNCSTARVLEEFLRELRGGSTEQSIRLMWETGLLRGWLHELDLWLQRPENTAGSELTWQLGPAISTQWGTQDAFWRHLRLLDQRAAQEDIFPDDALLCAFFLPLWWREMFHLYAQKPRNLQRLWRDAFWNSVDPLLATFGLGAQRRESFYLSMYEYWRLPGLAGLPVLPRSLCEKPHFPFMVELFRFELEAHELPIPRWVEQRKPDALGQVASFRWVM